MEITNGSKTKKVTGNGNVKNITEELKKLTIVTEQIKKSKTERQSRRFVFVLNNPKFDSDGLLEQFKCYKTIRYIVFQLEIAPVTNTPHFQGYIEFNQKQRTSTLQRQYIKGIAYKYAIGTAKQNRNYCKKNRTAVKGTFREWGEPVKQGQRTDIIQFKDHIKTNQNMDIRDMIDTFPIQMCLYPRFYNMCKFAYYTPYEDKNKQVILCIGLPGTGKTTYAFEYDKESNWDNIVGTSNWFDGFNNQKVAIIDDYGGDGTVFKLADLLKLTHGWTQKVPIKGGFTIWNPEVVIITTNYHPLRWYKLNADTDNDRYDRWISYEALVRRFTKILYFELDDKGDFQDPLECKDKEAFMYDIEEEFEHQIIPHKIAIKFRHKRTPKTMKELLMTTEKLVYDHPVYDEGYTNIVKKSESTLYNYSDVEDEEFTHVTEQYTDNH